MLAIPINLTIWTFIEHFRIRPREAEEAAAIQPPAQQRGTGEKDARGDAAAGRNHGNSSS
jgi:hypothetical protein